MGKKSGGGSNNINPSELAAQQAAVNSDTARTQARLNMVNQYTPYGSVEYEQRPGNEGEDYRVNVKLNPTQQSIFDTGQNFVKNQVGTLAQQLAGGPDFSQFGDVPGMGAQGRNALEDALFSRLEPSIERDRAALETQLANQGIAYGSDAWRNKMDDFSRYVGDQRTSVAIQGGQAEQDRQLAARNQAIQEMLLGRSIPLNELAAINSGSQVAMPTQALAPVPQTGVPATNVMGAYGLQQAAQQAAQQQQSSLFGGLLGLGGTLGGAGILTL